MLFQARFDVLLYDLTSTYFESDPPFAGKRQFGYSRDKRSDCVQVVIALVVTPQGFPLAYEVMPGNTSDKTTLKDFLAQIEAQYGRSDRVWIMDRGIPTEETLEQMRTGDSPVHYLVGTPKGRLSKFEKKFLTLPWQAVRPSVDVKLLSHDSELYILARSHPRTLKERAMRRRRLKKLWRRLHELQQQTLTRDELLLKLGAAKKEAGRAYHLVDIQIPDPKQPVTPETFTFSLRRDKLRTVRRREGRYLLRSNLRDEDPATLWQYYIRLTEIEQAFKELKHDLAIRPIYHQTDKHIEAHIFIAFIAYCLHVTLKQHARTLRPRTHTAGGAGEVRNDADGGRALAHHRRAPVGVAALHPTRPSPSTPLPTAQAETTGPTPASNLRLNPPLSSPSARGLVVPTFGFREPEINELCAFWPRVAEVGLVFRNLERFLEGKPLMNVRPPRRVRSNSNP